tara:strand:- start:46 stop:399 length:354 start_codon:yes stop_codon:yes gene_type:complete
MIQPRGLARVPLVVQSRTRSTSGATGEVSETWTDTAYVWARVETRGGIPKGEYEDGLQATERKIAVMDYDPSIKWSVTGTRLRERGVALPGTFNITEISDPGLVHHVIELTLEEAVE